MSPLSLWYGASSSCGWKKQSPYVEGSFEYGEYEDKAASREWSSSLSISCRANRPSVKRLSQIVIKGTIKMILGVIRYKSVNWIELGQ
jgi:hypothetical protein